jgi:hypothetical protein
LCTRPGSSAKLTSQKDHFQFQTTPFPFQTFSSDEWQAEVAILWHFQTQNNEPVRHSTGKIVNFAVTRQIDIPL